MVLELLIFLISLIFIKVLLNGYNIHIFKKGKAPPGPFKFPIIGNVPQIYLSDSSYAHLAFYGISKKYGEIVSLRFGSYEGVLLSSHDAVQEILSRDDCVDRYKYSYHDLRMPGHTNQGILLSSGKSWSEIRRFTLRKLRDFGYGKSNSLDFTILEAVNELSEKIQKELLSQNGIVEFNNYFSHSAVSLIWSYMFGYRPLLTDEKIKRNCELTDEYSKAVAVDNITLLFPILGEIFPKLTGISKFKEVIAEQNKFVRENIEDARKSLKKRLDGDSNSEPENFIEAFLMEIEKNKNDTNSYYTEEQLIVLISDLFIGGSETTSNFLSYAILLMVHYPEVQKKVQEEIDNVLNKKIGEKMTYTQAVILEIFRFSCIVPIFPPRRAGSEIIYKNYSIPKNSLIMVNIFPIFNDEKYWGDPQNFRPERFINSQNSIYKAERMNVFGYGKRVCPGEGLARISSFLYFATLLNKFEFKRIDNEELPSLKPAINFTLGPHPFRCLVKIR